MTTCCHCGESFKQTRSDQRYCGGNCRKRACDKRKAPICDVCGEKTSSRVTRRHSACGTAWTRERCIDALRDFYDEHGRGPTSGELGIGHPGYTHQRVSWLPWGSELFRRFGSVRKAFEAAGVPMLARGERLADRRVVREMAEAA